MPERGQNVAFVLFFLESKDTQISHLGRYLLLFFLFFTACGVQIFTHIQFWSKKNNYLPLAFQMFVFPHWLFRYILFYSILCWTGLQTKLSLWAWMFFPIWKAGVFCRLAVDSQLDRQYSNPFISQEVTWFNVNIIYTAHWAPFITVGTLSESAFSFIEHMKTFFH